MATSNRDWIATLKSLFETCQDGANGYRMAAEHARDEGLKTLFQGYAEQRTAFAAELQGELKRLGAHDARSGTVGAALHQGWASIKAAATSGGDPAWIAECEHGEDVARKLFEEALGQDLPADVQALVRRQCLAIREAHDRIRALETAAR